jgi:hypothetical protein
MPANDLAWRLNPSVLPRVGFDQQPVEDHGESERQHGRRRFRGSAQAADEHRRDQRSAGGAGKQHHRRVADPGAVGKQRRRIGAKPEVQALAEGNEPGAHEKQQAEHHEPLRDRQREQKYQPLGREPR